MAAICPDFDKGIISQAPLTLVRSESPTRLKISLIFNQRFQPLNPIVPEPLETIQENSTIKYSWSVFCGEDGVLYSRRKKDVDLAVRMLWWEVIRRDPPVLINPDASFYVPRYDLKRVLGAIFNKFGMRPQEFSSFAQFWDEYFFRDPSMHTHPFLLVQMLEDASVSNYLPEMQVEGEKADRYIQKRFYFRFLPIINPIGMNSTAYLEHLQDVNLGPNVVFDLGGEIAQSTNLQFSLKNSEEANRNFIKNCVLVNSEP